MGELITVVVSKCDAFREEVANCVESSRLPLVYVSEFEELKQYLQEPTKKISAIVTVIDNNLDELERDIRSFKRKEDAKYIPCIGLTSNKLKSSNIPRQLFFHILERPANNEILIHTIEAAQSDFKRYQALISEVNSRTSAIGLISSGKFKLRSLKEAEALTTMLSLACPDPATVALGLSEILVNAIEHGNLNISYQEKSDLLENGLWDDEIQKRLNAPEYVEKFVEINFSRNENQIQIQVTDQGNGFDWRKFVDRDPSNNNAKHGRGIAIAIAMGFNQLEYNDKGNQVTAIIDL